MISEHRKGMTAAPMARHLVGRYFTARCCLLFLFALVFATGNAFSGQAVPDTLPGATVVSADWLKNALDKHEPIVVVDARIPSEYKDGHLPGAINIFDDTFAQEKSHLPSDKSLPLVFYCNGPKCLKSYESAKKALSSGYSRVYWLRGGIPEWTTRGYPLE